MSTTIGTPAVATPVVETPAVKVEKKVLPTIEAFKEITVAPFETTAFIVVEDALEYAQIKSAVNEMKNVKLISSAKEGVLIINKSELNSAALVKFINPALADADKVVIRIVYGDYEKMRISAKVAGTSKVKAPVRSASSFFDRDLNGMIDEGNYNYIYGVEGATYSKLLNTIIARVVKTLYTGKLYSDEIKPENRGFHKSQTRIPVNEAGLRTVDNYSFFFKWNKIVELLGAVDGQKCVDTIVAIFAEVYPDLVIDTTKDLYIECLKSEFATIGKERLVWDETEGKIVSKKEALEKEKEAKKLEKEALKAEKAEKAKADKKAAGEAVAEAVAGEEVVLGVAPVAPVATPVAPVATPVANTVAPIGVPVIGAAPVINANPVVAPAPVIGGIAANDLINGQIKA